MENSNGYLWIATDAAGLALRRNGTWTIYTSFEDVPGTGNINCLEEATVILLHVIVRNCAGDTYLSKFVPGKIAMSRIKLDTPYVRN